MANVESTNSVEKTQEATAENIFALRHRVPVRPYDIPDVGMIYIHGFTGAEKAAWMKECRNKAGTVKTELVESLMVQMCARDKAGNRLFRYIDISKIRALPASVLGAICDICMELSGMGYASDLAILKNFENGDEQPESGDSLSD